MISQTESAAQRPTIQVDPAGLGNVVAAFSGNGVYNNSGGLTAHYTNGLGLVSQVSPVGTASYYDFDITGNTVGITGSTGSLREPVRLPAIRPDPHRVCGCDNPFTFVGQFGVMDDGSGLLHMRARNYDPVTGQFTESDPLGLFGGDCNVRRYVPTDQ